MGYVNNTANTGSLPRDAFKNLVPASSTSSDGSNTAATTTSSAIANIGKTAAATALPFGAINPVALAATTAANLAATVARYSSQQQQPTQPQQPADQSWMALAGMIPALTKMLSGENSDKGDGKKTNSNSNLQQANNSVNNNPGLGDKPVKVKAEDSSPTTDSK